MLGESEKHIAELKRVLDSDARAMEENGARYSQLVRQASLIDQKSSSMLTYLAILLAGVSILFVGGNGEDESLGLIDVLMMIEFVIVFAAAFVFLSCAKMVSFKHLLFDEVDELLETAHKLISGRYTRFRLGFTLTAIILIKA